ncbi:hypothetical protein EMIHUDRAFT_243347 [Emiliania huxleyi CCMP1516]|uniref:Uncharacterized protein n=2 Tax=Emiliania huxleyi TaxID=2903 RepID=A0A0D3J6C6_EMIH1|nr:hypothetical protein EMIHUDRAFT_243347 [Emiliania huxleyi CCMP1516]EOD19061.1 hypothetical protein EMIHUDRAFT_243347 [Emiliania huxleyi CCMP1516]|eukprot:XP_005771490.1 hypothetical protein EMIHUDRAFT_243347 [Emiliania huxleyi CCMP1516]
MRNRGEGEGDGCDAYCKCGKTEPIARAQALSVGDHPQPADHTADAATVAALSVDGPPLRLIVFARAFRAIWVLKRWAFRAAERRASSRRHARRPPGAAERLRQRLRLYGMQMLRIAGDGFCDDFGAYLRRMQRNRTWGDELTLRAASEALAEIARDRARSREIARERALGASLHVVTSTEFNPYLVYTPSEQKMDKQASAPPTRGKRKQRQCPKPRLEPASGGERRASAEAA